MLILAVANQKGGVGKTATAANLGYALAEAGRRVLLIDADPQASLSLSFGLSEPELGTSEFLTIPTVTLRQVAVPAGHEGLFLCPTSSDLAGTQVALSRFPASRRNEAACVLRDKLARSRDFADLALVDSPPSLGLLSVNALAAARFVIIPVQCALLSLAGLRLLLDTITEVQQSVNADLGVLGILPTMRAHTVHGREAEALLRDRFGELVFETVIPRTVRFDDATAVKQPLVAFDHKSPGAEAYRALAKEVLDRAEAVAA